MIDPSTQSAVAVAVTGAGITVFGVALGLHPELLLAGFCGAMWSLSICDPMPALRRITVSTISTFVAGYLTPALSAVVLAHNVSWLPPNLTGEIVQYPLAMMIGFLSHQVIGPWLLRAAGKKAEVTK